MTAKILLILVLVTTIIPVSLLFGIPASEYNKRFRRKKRRNQNEQVCFTGQTK